MSIPLQIENFSTIMDDAFDEWVQACHYLERNPGSKMRIDEVRKAHEKFLIARQRYIKLIEEISLYLKSLQRN